MGGFGCRTGVQIDAPGDIVTLQGGGQFSTRGVVTGDITKEQVQLPSSVLTVAPTDTQREDTHITGILNHEVSRDQ